MFVPTATKIPDKQKTFLIVLKIFKTTPGSKWHLPHMHWIGRALYLFRSYALEPTSCSSEQQNTSKPTHQGPKGPLGATDAGPSELMKGICHLLSAPMHDFFEKRPSQGNRKRQQKKKFLIWQVLVTLGRRNQMATLYQSSYPRRKTSDWACIVATWWLNRWEYGAEVCCQFSFYIILCAAVIILTTICHHDHLSLVIIICHNNSNNDKNNKSSSSLSSSSCLHALSSRKRKRAHAPCSGANNSSRNVRLEWTRRKGRDHEWTTENPLTYQQLTPCLGLVVSTKIERHQSNAVAF